MIWTRSFSVTFLISEKQEKLTEFPDLLNMEYEQKRDTGKGPE